MNRLLVIDDEPLICDFVSEVAVGCGYRCAVASEPDLTRELLDSFDPTHIVLDLAMPHQDGIEVMRELAGRGFGGDIILISATGDRTLAAARRLGRAQGLQVIGVLRKPLRLSELRAALDGAGIMADTPSVEDIRAALDGDEFYLVFQPQVDAASHEVAGVEALIRWRRGGRNIWPPSSFIGAVERSPLVGRFTDTVLGLAFRQIVAWHGQGLDPKVSINISGANVCDVGFPDHVSGLCHQAGVDPARISLEVTEAVAMSDPVTALDSLLRLSLKGFSLAIDDFGTGFSSLVELHRMPFDTLKIDKSLVMRCVEDADCHTIVTAVADLARALGLRVVAEGVEGAEVWRAVRGAGCDVGQGFFFGPPMVADDIAAWARGRKLAEIPTRPHAALRSV